MNIERIDVVRLAIPLETPYRLAFGPVTHYDTVIVDIAGAGGETGCGAATLLTGYTDETLDEGWALARAGAADLVDVDTATAGDRHAALGARAPFIATAFRTALDAAAQHPLLAPRAGTRVPILGLLQGHADAALVDAFERLVAGGHRTIKIKVGFDVDDDIAFVRRVQAIVQQRVPIRVDANQGYTAAQAARFIAATDPAGIELFEQPCASRDWHAHRVAAAQAARTGLPLMLDESIYGLADIERAAGEHACRFVKVKLMKFVGVDALVAAIERIRALGMTPVLGNGVAADLGCWMEACVAAQCIDNAGEMNGFLKPRTRLFAHPLVFDRGDIVLGAAAPRRDADAAAPFVVHRERFVCGGIACRAPS
jgi:L-alanine-DL-glutamate epimerase-like enolase superfamily enzyme